MPEGTVNSEELAEKVARAIFASMASRAGGFLGTDAFDDEAYEYTRSACMEDATAAIDAVLAAGYRRQDNAGIGTYIEAARAGQKRIAELEAQLAEAKADLDLANELHDHSVIGWQVEHERLAERDVLIEKVRAYAEDRAFHAKGHLNTVNSGRIASDLQAILAAAPASVLGEAKRADSHLSGSDRTFNGWVDKA